MTVHLSQWLSANPSLGTHGLYFAFEPNGIRRGLQVVWLTTGEAVLPANNSVAIVGFLGTN
jgi:hypothetical protein